MPALPFNPYYLTASLLAACTIIGITVAARFRREVDEDLSPTSTKDLLDPLEKAYYSGLMHPSEIEKIREAVQRNHSVQPVNSKVAPKARATSQAGTASMFTDGGSDDAGSPPADHHGGEDVGGADSGPSHHDG